MRLLGISGSPRKDDISRVFSLVRMICENSGLEYEMLSLRDFEIAGCMGCLDCVNDNVCTREDGMQEIRERLLAADGLVVGAPCYMGGLNAGTHAFLERLFQFRHDGDEVLWGRIAVVAGVGMENGELAANELARLLAAVDVETVARVVDNDAPDPALPVVATDLSASACDAARDAGELLRLLLESGVRLHPVLGKGPY